MINDCISGLYTGIFPDKRLDKRMNKIAADLLLSATATVNKAIANNAPKKAAYSALTNKHDILRGSYRKCAENIDVEHVLCIQDTTEFNFN